MAWQPRLVGPGWVAWSLVVGNWGRAEQGWIT